MARQRWRQDKRGGVKLSERPVDPVPNQHCEGVGAYFTEEEPGSLSLKKGGEGEMTSVTKKEDLRIY